MPPLLLTCPPHTLGNLRDCMRNLEDGTNLRTPRGRILQRQVASAMCECEATEPDIDLDRPRSTQGEELKGMVVRLRRCLKMEVYYMAALEHLQDLHFERYQSLYLDRTSPVSRRDLWNAFFESRGCESVPNRENCRRRLATAAEVMLDTDGQATNLLRSLSYLLGEGGDDDEETATLDVLVMCGGMDPFSKVHDDLQTFVMDGVIQVREQLDLDTVTRDLSMVEERLAPKYSAAIAEVRQAIQGILRVGWPDFE